MLLQKNLFSGHRLRQTPSSALMKLFCSTQACTNLSNNMQMKNNTVSNTELLNELATAFSRPCLQGEKRKQEDTALMGLEPCYKWCGLRRSCSQGREGIRPRLQTVEEHGCSSCRLNMVRKCCGRCLSHKSGCGLPSGRINAAAPQHGPGAQQSK